MSKMYFGFNSTQEKTLRNLDLAVGASVDTDALQDDAVTQAKIANDAVGADQLAANAVVDASVAAGAAIALSKLADVAAGDDGLAAASLTVNLQDLFTQVTNLNTWAAALATKLNADAGVTDADYDTDPQA
jgi:hypothetical protein